MRKVRVLVADDDKMNRIMISRLIEKIGAECKTADDGKSAMEMSRSDVFDIIFLDFNMPVFSGEECARMIKSEYTERDVKMPLVVGISADEEHSENPLFDKFLTKPFTLVMLQEIINDEGDV